MADPWNETLVAIDIAEPEYATDEFVYDGEESGETAPPANPAAEAAPSPDDSEHDGTEEAATSTIYQRRGGGIKRRVAAMHIVENDEAS